MTVHDLYRWVALHGWATLAVGMAVPLAVSGVAGPLALLGWRGPSQQIANAGIAVGLAAVLIELLALVYAVSVVGVNPLAETPVALLGLPPWLLVTGLVVEHLIHPGTQEAVRRPIRTAGLGIASVAVVGLGFSVLDIHLLVFSGMFGFIAFVAVLIALFAFVIHRAV